jgi:hypothetical protein
MVEKGKEKGETEERSEAIKAKKDRERGLITCCCASLVEGVIKRAILITAGNRRSR